MQRRVGVMVFLAAVWAAGCATTRERPAERGAAGVEAAKQWTVEPGALGVVRVEALESGRYAVTVLFPGVGGADAFSEGAPVDLRGSLVFFDGQGVLATLQPKGSPALRAWCDGQLRAELPMVVEQSQLLRALQPVGDVQQLAAFVRVVQEAAAEIPVSSGAVFAPSRAVLWGDVNADGVPEAWVTAAQPAGVSCDGAPPDGRAVTLGTADRQWPLRCCR